MGEMDERILCAIQLLDSEYSAQTDDGHEPPKYVRDVIDSLVEVDVELRRYKIWNQDAVECLSRRRELLVECMATSPSSTYKKIAKEIGPDIGGAIRDCE